MICLFKNWDSHISMWKSQNRRTVANSLWKASYSSELTTERTAELGGKKKNEKQKKWTSFSIWKISMWSPNIRRGNPWDDGGLPALSSRTQNEGSVWSPISTGVPRPRRKNAKCRFYFHSLLSFLYYFHFLFLFLIYFENLFFFFLLSWKNWQSNQSL